MQELLACWMNTCNELQVNRIGNLLLWSAARRVTSYLYDCLVSYEFRPYLSTPESIYWRYILTGKRTPQL